MNSINTHTHSIDIALIRYLIAFVIVIGGWGLIAYDFSGRLYPKLTQTHPAPIVQTPEAFAPGIIITAPAGGVASIPQEKIDSLFTNLRP